MKKNRITSSALAALFATTLGFSAAPPAHAQTATVDTEVSDALAAVSVKSKLIEKLGADGLRISVEAMGSKVVLTGQVEKRESEEMAKEIALSVTGVKDVDNRVKQNPDNKPSAIKNIELEVKDAALESKVKNILLTEVGKNALKIEIEATDGAISLRGTVPTADIASAAVAKTKAISGVRKVVNLLKTRA